MEVATFVQIINFPVRGNDRLDRTPDTVMMPAFIILSAKVLPQKGVLVLLN